MHAGSHRFIIQQAMLFPPPPPPPPPPWPSLPAPPLPPTILTPAWSFQVLSVDALPKLLLNFNHFSLLHFSSLIECMPPHLPETSTVWSQSSAAWMVRSAAFLLCLVYNICTVVFFFTFPWSLWASLRSVPWEIEDASQWKGSCNTVVPPFLLINVLSCWNFCRSLL